MKARVAIVAGAATGLGHATALALHEAGLTVVAIDRTEAGLKELPEGIHREVADATDPTVPGPLIEHVVASIGAPDVLVNTIGAYELGDALSVTPQTLSRMIDVNLGAALWLTQAVAPHMQQKGAGVIVHVAARPGVEPTAGAVAYGVSKAALVHLTRTLDLELRPHGIRVNAVVPQLIATAKNRSFLPPEVMAGAVEPEAIADVIAFLVSDAAGSISGDLISTYGG